MPFADFVDLNPSDAARNNRLCCVQDGPAVPESALLGDTCADGVAYCTVCTRAAMLPIVTLAQSRCGSDPLFDTIILLTQTPPELVGAVLLILAPALVELDGYVEQVGRHA